MQGPDMERSLKWLTSALMLHRERGRSEHEIEQNSIADVTKTSSFIL